MPGVVTELVVLPAIVCATNEGVATPPGRDAGAIWLATSMQAQDGPCTNSNPTRAFTACGAVSLIPTPEDGMIASSRPNGA